MRNPFPMAKCFNDQRPLINENKCENSMTLFYMLALQNRLNMKRKFKKVMINNSTNINKTYIHLSPQSFSLIQNQGRIQDFKLGGAHLKKFLGVFRVKNHNFTPTNHIFSNCGGRRENCWGISCEKSRFYAKKSYFFQLWREAWKFLGYFVWKITILRQQIWFFPVLGGARPPLDPPLH